MGELNIWELMTTSSLIGCIPNCMRKRERTLKPFCDPVYVTFGDNGVQISGSYRVLLSNITSRGAYVPRVRDAVTLNIVTCNFIPSRIAAVGLNRIAGRMKQEYLSEILINLLVFPVAGTLAKGENIDCKR